MAKLYIKNNDGEIGIELTGEELMSCFEFIGSCFTTDHVDQLTKILADRVKTDTDKKSTPVKAEDLLKREEKSEEPEEATDEERYIECYTFCDTTSNKEKATLVRAWLKKNEIKYVIDPVGIKKYAYKLTPQQLIELQDYLMENDVTSWEANV